MDIASIEHKALRNFAQTGKTAGLPGNLVVRLRNMLAYLSQIGDVHELRVPPNFGAHLLKEDRAGVWALTVTRNWRMTFRINDALEIEDMDLEDYH
jgi:proteic killer suppression protein